MPYYFCHQCNHQKDSSDVSTASGSLTCITCGSEFIEEINDENSQELPSSQSGAAAAAVFDAATDPLLQPLFHFHQHHPHQQQLEGELFGTLPVFRFGLNPVIGMLDSGALDHVMTQLLSQVDNGGAAPPATRAELARIKSVSICHEQVATGMQCFVCLEDFREGDRAERLPCQHHFHCQCIRPWLEKRGTCPVCRQSLSAQDAEDVGGVATATAAESRTEGADGGAEPGIFGAFGFGTSSHRSGLLPSSASAASSSSSSVQTARRGSGGGGYVEDDCD